MAGIPDGTICTGEDLRCMLLDAHGVAEPRHPGVWGALTGSLVRRGILQPTGEWRPMRQKSSHGRKTPVYVVRAALDNAAA